MFVVLPSKQALNFARMYDHTDVVRLPGAQRVLRELPDRTAVCLRLSSRQPCGPLAVALVPLWTAGCTLPGHRLLASGEICAFF